ncbi:LOW QUALITY PROTEIN: Fc receptor-like A [Sylvia atricapilla]|uniref:LOW QUALITY PROTEIN: Fc receptor-like A n=1 Tax=Sylvia atricapilla TaxID=48155 RepID=UPI003390A640
MAGDTGMAGKVALLLWAQCDQSILIINTSVLQQCSIIYSLGADTTPCPAGAAVPAGPPSPSPVSSPFQPRPLASLVSPQEMPCPSPTHPSPVLALAGWCPLSPAGAQTTQLLVEPPWRPAVLWDQVTLTCQGSGTASVTTRYKDGQRWWLKGPDNFRVTQSGPYMCERSGSGLSPPVRVLNDRLVLQVPARTLLEGDTVTLRCRHWKDMLVSRVRFYQDKKDLGGSLSGPELSLSPVQVQHSGRYHCVALMSSGLSLSIPVTVTVHELFTAPVLEGPPEPTEGSPLNLSCLSTPSPLRPPGPLLYLFYRDGQLVGGPQGSPQLLVPTVGVSHSGNYSCQVRSEGGAVQKSSARLRVTVHMPVANATITPGPLSHQVHSGDPVTLCCSVQVGSAPVTFTWLHNGQEVAHGDPWITLGHRWGYMGSPGCSGFLGFRVILMCPPLSPAVAGNVGRTVLFLVLLLAVIGGCHCWHRTGG